MCGSCAMTVNGRPRWTCRTHVQKVIKNNSITIEPLRNLPVIKDLACDLSEFFTKWTQAKGQFSSTLTREQPVEKRGLVDLMTLLQRGRVHLFLLMLIQIEIGILP